AIPDPGHRDPRPGPKEDQMLLTTGDQGEGRSALRMYPADASVTVDGMAFALGGTEFAVLQHLAANVGELVPWAELSTTIWGDTSPAGTRTLRVAVRRLQRKLGRTRVHMTED